MKVSPSTLARAAAKLRLHGELKLADALAPRQSLKAPKSRRPAKVEKAAKRETRRERIRRIRAAVEARSGGRCEAYLYWSFSSPSGTSGSWQRCTEPGSVGDHWLGGSGRRRAEESVENVWHLCTHCDRGRTLNEPSAQHWNDSFEKHCSQHGYPFTPHITRNLQRPEPA